MYSVCTYCFPSACSCSHFLPYLSLLAFPFHPPTTPELYTLSLHDALPISDRRRLAHCDTTARRWPRLTRIRHRFRSEEHTSELQSRGHLVCRLLLEKKNKIHTNYVEKFTGDGRIVFNLSIIHTTRMHTVHS